MEVKAVSKNTGVSPRKVRLLVDMVRGKKVDEALAVLRFTPSPTAQVVAKDLEEVSPPVARASKPYPETF